MSCWLLLFWACWALVVYTYALFPLLLALLARLLASRPAAPAPLPEDQLPHVTMLVAAYNEERSIGDKLANAWSLDYPPDRLVLMVGSDGSTDETNSVLEACSDPRLRAFPFAERRGKVSVLNDLVQAADAEILAVSDANSMLAPDAVRLLVAHFADPRVQCVSGEMVLDRDGGPSGEGLYWRYEQWIKRSESRLGFLVGCNGGIFAIRRSAYPILPASTIVEDFVTCLRVLERGGRVVFEPRAIAVEPPSPSSRAEMVRKIRIAAGGFQAIGMTRDLLHPRHGLVAFAYWGHRVLRWCVPAFLIAALVANCALARVPFFAAMLAAQIAGGLIALTAYLLPPGASLPKLLRPVSYFFLMNYAIACGFISFVRGSQKATWERSAR